jgi:hypothetical protein
MSDDDLHALVRQACDKAAEYVKSPVYERDKRILDRLLERIEAALKIREFDEFRRKHRPWMPPRINPWGC